MVQSHFLLLSSHLYPFSFVHHPVTGVQVQKLNTDLEKEEKADDKGQLNVKHWLILSKVIIFFKKSIFK